MQPADFTDLNITARTLLGPGPSNVPPRVMAAMLAPTIGHLDVQFQQVMDDVRKLLRYVFKTQNPFTLPVSGTGSAGMEAAVANLIEPGDPALFAVKGYFGLRMVEMARRYGAQVDVIEKPWGEVFTPDDIRAAFEKKTYKFLGIVHGETSTGVLQPYIQEIAAIAHQYGALLVLDTVASLVGAPVETEAWGIDVVYSGSQKCLSMPPGLAPITLSPRALAAVQGRKTKTTCWYLDLNQLDSYWGAVSRVYHHTAPINLNYALRESLRLVLEEGLENQLARHRQNAELLWDGLESLGLRLVVPLAYRNPALTTVYVPEGIQELEIRKALMSDYNIEISGGLGPFAGKIWRIGLMGHSSRRENVTLLLAALQRLL